MSLLNNLKEARNKERQATYLVLKYLGQVSRTKHHLKLSYPSMHKFLIKELGYSAGEAAIRLSALKLMLKNKTVEKKIKSGEINLTKASKLSSLLERSEEEIKAPMIEKICHAIKETSVKESEVIVMKALNL